MVRLDLNDGSNNQHPTSNSPSADVIDMVDEAMCELAAQFNSEYEGWEAEKPLPPNATNVIHLLIVDTRSSPTTLFFHPRQPSSFPTALHARLVMPSSFPTAFCAHRVMPWSSLTRLSCTSRHAAVVTNSLLCKPRHAVVVTNSPSCRPRRSGITFHAPQCSPQ